MGSEHAFMDVLADYAAGRPMKPLAMPQHGFGEDSPNWKALRCAIWLLQKKPGAVARCEAFYEEMALRGHCCVGTAVEVLTPSHAQLWYAAAAGHLLGARLAGATDLERAATAWWRVETAACSACSYVDAAGDYRVLTPGARAWSKKTNEPQVVNSLRDKVIGWLCADRMPRAAKKGSYDVAIPLLFQAFTRGAQRADLAGSDYSSLTGRFGFHVHGQPGDYFAWFENLDGAADAVYGAGFRDGDVVLSREREHALDIARHIGAA